MTYEQWINFLRWFSDDDACDAEDIEGMTDAEVDAELRWAGIDPDAAWERLRAKLAERGIHFPEEKP